MYSCNIDIVDNHILLNYANKRILLDTGSPASVGDGQAWEFLGTTTILRSDFAGWPLDKLCSIGGLDFDILLGMDLLGQHRLRFDVRSKTIVFDDEKKLFGFTTLDIEDVMGIPKVPLKLEAVRSKALIDTGAKLSYIPRRFHELKAATDTQFDFYPGFGRFETCVRTVEFEFAGRRIDLVCGVLPTALAGMLPVGNNVCILGCDLFKLFILEFDFQEKTLTVAEINEE